MRDYAHSCVPMRDWMIFISLLALVASEPELSPIRQKIDDELRDCSKAGDCALELHEVTHEQIDATEWLASDKAKARAVVDKEKRRADAATWRRRRRRRFVAGGLVLVVVCLGGGWSWWVGGLGG